MDGKLGQYLASLNRLKQGIKLKIGDDSGKPAEVNSLPTSPDGDMPDGDDISMTIRVNGKPVRKLLDQEEDVLE